MKVGALCAMALAAAIHAGPGQAQFVRGDELVEYMKAWEEAGAAPSPGATVAQQNRYVFLSAPYLNYIIAVADALQGADVACIPLGASRLQAGAVVAKYLKENPEKWNGSAAFLVIDGLAKGFPCKK